MVSFACEPYQPLQLLSLDPAKPIRKRRSTPSGLSRFTERRRLPSLTKNKSLDIERGLGYEVRGHVGASSARGRY
jgi:hypothetical protein